MNTKIIDQIRKIGGVKLVEPAGKDMAVVVFEGENTGQLIEEARRRFPIGTRFRYKDGIATVVLISHWCSKGIIYCGGIRGEEWDIVGCSNPILYENGKWAEIVTEKKKPIFVTEDGVEIYKDELYWMVWQNKGWRIDTCHAGTLSPNTWRFSTKQAAEVYILKQKEAELIKEAEKRGLVDGVKYKWDNKQNLGIRTVEYPLHSGSQGYLADAFGNILHNAEGEWPTVIKEPASLKPEELVEGEIYFDEDEPDRSGTFRYKQKHCGDIMCHSRLFKGHSFSARQVFRTRFIRPATLLEKQQLIRAEIVNNFFFNLK